MAERRMFAKSIIDSDSFMDMPATTQLLYFHLSVRADDDGFIGNPKRIIRMVGASDDDFRLLLAKQYILSFESGVIVIRHWRIHNYIRQDRYRQTEYAQEKEQLHLDRNNAYTKEPTDGYLQAAVPEIDCARAAPQAVDQRYTNGRPAVDQASYQRLPQVSIVKDNLETEIGKERETPARAHEEKPSERHKYGLYGWIRLSDEEYTRLVSELGQTELERCISYIDESAQATGNKNKWRDWNLILRKCHRNGWGIGGRTAGAQGERKGNDIFAKHDAPLSELERKAIALALAQGAETDGGTG